MNPKYSIGELVILNSKTFPEYNGEYTIRRILQEEDHFDCRASGHVIRKCGEGYGYLFEEICTKHYKDIEIEINWDESALRKKHQKGDYSFSELMSTLKIGEKA